jgi:hypothetical protein
MSIDQRQAAAARIAELIALLRTHPSYVTAAIIEECEALARAVTAFHMEGIRFRMFNVDRLLNTRDVALPPGAGALLEEARRHLEAAGFHTRSHQAPG